MSTFRLAFLLPCLLAVAPIARTAETPADVAAQIAKLGADSFDDRESASKALTNMPAATQEVLDAARAQAQDPEVRSRLDMLIEQRKKNAFLGKLKEGMETTPSGLGFKELTPGKGDSPRPMDQVLVHYRGKLIDGTEFDSSYARKEPATFGLDQVIKGWTEGLQKMKPGGKYVLLIPPELAYGQQGAGAIQPNSTLIFEIELLEVVRKN